MAQVTINQGGGSGNMTIYNQGVGVININRGAVTVVAGCTAPVFISSASKACGNASANCQVTLLNVGIADEIVVSIIANQAAATSMYASSTGNSTFTAHTRITNAAGPTSVCVFTASSNVAGSVVIFATVAAAVDFGLQVACYRNIAVPPVDFDTQATGTESGSGTTFNTGAFTTANANNVLYAVLGNESTAITNISLTSTAATLIKLGDELTNTSSQAYAITSSTQTSKTGTATWTTASTDGVMILAVLRAACGI